MDDFSVFNAGTSEVTIENATLIDIVYTLRELNKNLTVKHDLTEEEIKTGRYVSSNIAMLMARFVSLSAKNKFNFVERRIRESKVVTFTVEEVHCDQQPLPSSLGVCAESKAESYIIASVGAAMVGTDVEISKDKVLIKTRPKDVYGVTSAFPQELLNTKLGAGIKRVWSLSCDIQEKRDAMVRELKTFPSGLAVALNLCANIKTSNAVIKRCFQEPSDTLKEQSRELGMTLSRQFVPVMPKIDYAKVDYPYLLGQMSVFGQAVGLLSGKNHHLCAGAYIGDLPATIQTTVLKVMSVTAIMRKLERNTVGFAHASDNVLALLAQQVRVFSAVSPKSDKEKGFVGDTPDLYFDHDPSLSSIIDVHNISRQCEQRMIAIKNVLVGMAGKNRNVIRLYEAFFFPDMLSIPNIAVLPAPMSHAGRVYFTHKKFVKVSNGSEKVYLSRIMLHLYKFVYYPFTRSRIWRRDNQYEYVPVVMTRSKRVEALWYDVGVILEENDEEAEVQESWYEVERLVKKDVAPEEGQEQPINFGAFNRKEEDDPGPTESPEESDGEELEKKSKKKDVKVEDFERAATDVDFDEDRRF